MKSIAASPSVCDHPLPPVSVLKRIKKRGYPLVMVTQEYRMLLWQVERVRKLAQALASDDKATGVVDAQTSTVLETIGARLAEVRTLLQEVLTPDMLAVIAQEEAEFTKLIAWKEKAGAGKTLVTA